MKTEPNEPINATFGYDQSALFVDVKHEGLTKLEHYAGIAMLGLISNAPTNNLGNCKEGAQLAIKWALALIDELNKQP